MAVLDGMVLVAPDSGVTNDRLSLGLHDFAYHDWPRAPLVAEVSHADVRTAFAYVDNLPVAADNAHAIDGVIPITYFDDFYNRIHAIPILLALGNVVSAQVRTIDIWNSWLVDQTLTAITGGGEGLLFDGPDVFPMTFGPIQLSAWEVSITPDGPPVIDVSYTWHFTGLPDTTVGVTGNRVVAWRAAPNWLDPVRESLTWLTDVQRVESGKEQRITLAEGPRQGWSFTFDCDGQLRRIVENEIYDWGARIWALPIWPDIEHLASPLAAGATSIPVTTATRDYHVGGIGLLLSADGLTYESFEIDAVNADSIDLVRPLLGSWPVGTACYPARLARLTGAQGLGRFTAGMTTAAADFETVEQILRTYSSEPLYRSMPVLEREPNWRTLPQIEYRRQTTTLDNLTGTPLVQDHSGLAEPAQTVLWTAFGRAEIDALRKFLYSRRGRWRGIWVPTFAADLILASTVGASQGSIDVRWCGLALHVDANVSRRDIRIELVNGTVYYRRVSAFVVVDDDTERMTLDAVLGATVAPADVARISWMMFARLDEDAVDIEWPSASLAEATITLTGPRNVH